MLTGAGRLGLIPRCDVVVAAERLDARFWWTGGKVGRAATHSCASASATVARASGGATSRCELSSSSTPSGSCSASASASTDESRGTVGFGVQEGRRRLLRLLLP